MATKKKSVKKIKRKSKKTKKKKKAGIQEKLVTPGLDIEEYEPEVKKGVVIRDLNRGSTKYAWIGAGQCGGRLIKSFYELGYMRLLACNTTNHDLDLLEIPKGNKLLMDIGEMGAGKDMARGRDAVQKYRQDVIHMMEKVFGYDVNHIMICFGAGGGTGGGSATYLVDLAKKYARHIGISNPDRHVGVMLTLPTVGEASSPVVSRNDYTIVSELGQMASEGKISPLVIVDNEKIRSMYPGLTVKRFWPTINNTVAGLFDIFNKVSALSSPYTSFDSADYHSIMGAGGCAIMGITKVKEFRDRFALSKAISENLEKTLLAGGFDLASATVAGCVVVGGKKLMATVPGLQDNINYAFDVLADITGKATVHRGIYEDQKDSLRVYTIIGGLDVPTERLLQLK